ncbi:MAG: AzlC family ABC transporter permease [Fibrobacterales bacterium]|nr:AzlC family ABC transporter permease [Fibrobacterales bacterium]
MKTETTPEKAAETPSEFAQGAKDSVPIALGYLAVSFSVGIMAANGGFGLLQASVMSMTNMTSAGEFAGIQVIAFGGALAELALTQLIINLRYALMSLSLSQKLSGEVTLWQRFVVAAVNTDEIFALAVKRAKSLTFRYMLGLEIFPVVGWTTGTFLGAFSSTLMPESVSRTMSVLLYGMFIAIVVPEARRARPILVVSLLAVVLSCLFHWAPGLKEVSFGIAVIVCTVAASAVGAVLFPLSDVKQGDDE